MTQPGFVPIQRLYTRVLSILGVEAAAQRQLVAPLSVQNVQVLGDLSDVVEPHQNPVFGLRATLGATALNHQVISIQAGRRPVRIWSVFIEAGASVRIGVFRDNIITAAEIEFDCVDISPVGSMSTSQARTQTARTRQGEFVAAAMPARIGNLASFRAELVHWNMLRPSLVAPNNFFTLWNHAINDAMDVSVIWEEVPGQGEVEGMGFPV